MSRIHAEPRIKGRKQMTFRIAVCVAALMAFNSGNLDAPAIFEGFSLPSTAIATGHTELAGSVTLTMRGGTVGADILIVDLSGIEITNANAADIQVLGGGGVTVGATVLDAEEGELRIP